MRVLINDTDIYEIKIVTIDVGGKENEDKPGTYHDIICRVNLIYGDNESEYIVGEFNCSETTTFKEAKLVAKPFIDELYKYGCIDISTDNKCKKYNMKIIYD